ncbi:hypothetical protein MWU78_18435 [Arenibacter sp. F26102]|uniref:hypothetical protein n=1 Tax=Arenibacter sp. F26102 TaxID=2926416 RepID=UPI001FF64100|nr:hypothetical protein [Arenibacter sp. F26102]MCK0147639.1 hypothetical protein [Arenibacter sp. F26102]
MKPIMLMFFLLGVLFLGSCNRMKGTYVGADQSHFDKIVFTSKHTVELIFLGSVVEAEYEKVGGEVKINTAMGTQVLNIDTEGCLDGGFIMGKYCKE